MKRMVLIGLVLVIIVSIVSMFSPQVNAQAATLPWRDDFDYNTLDEMKAAGWTLDGEERISVGGGVVTLDNDGAQGSGINYTKGFRSHIYDFSVETKSRWVGRDYGQDGNFYVQTQRHDYCWYGDGYYPEYVLVRDGIKVLRFQNYTPIMNTWTTWTLKKEGNIFYMYQDGELKNTYTDPDEAPDELVTVRISCGWRSTMEYDYILVSEVEPVGGFWIPVDKLSLLAPYIALVSTIILAVSMSVAYIKHGKKR